MSLAPSPTNSTSLAALKERTKSLPPETPLSFFSVGGLDLMQRAATMLSCSTLVPTAYRNVIPDKKTGQMVKNDSALSNCVLALNMAQRISADPLMIMQNLYIVEGRPGWFSKFVIVSINACGKFSPLRFKNAWGCQIEHAAAKKYGLTILYEDEPETNCQCDAKTYIGVKRLKAFPQEREGLPGYHVIYEDGYESWSPKDVFERAYFAIERPDKLTQPDINDFMASSTFALEKRGEKTTMVEVHFPTGWLEYEMSSCVDPANYDQELGEKICLGKITDRLWSHLDFVLQWADHRLK